MSELDDFQILGKAVERPSSIDDAAVSLELRLQQEIDSRKEERFWWICGTALLTNVLFAQLLTSVLINLLLVLLQVPVLVRFAVRCGVEDVAIWWQYVMSKLSPPKDEE